MKTPEIKPVFPDELTIFHQTKSGFEMETILLNEDGQTMDYSYLKIKDGMIEVNVKYESVP